MAESRSKRKALRIVGFVLLIIIAVIVVVYIGGIIFFQSHFMIGTRINNVKCGMQNVAKAEQTITDAVQNFAITVKEREGKKETLNGKDFSMDVTFDSSLKDVLQKQKSAVWPVMIGKQRNEDVGVTVSYDETALNNAVQQLECMKASNMKSPVNAMLEYNSDEKKYELVDSKPGTTVIPLTVKNKAAECVRELQPELDLSKEQCYKTPEYIESDEVVKNVMDEANKYVSTTVTYEYGDDTITVDASDISQWITVSPDFKVGFKKNTVQKFVSDMAAKYDTIYTNREFQTSYDFKINISQGDYGWWTDRVAECKSLIAFIKTGKSGTKEPVYYQEAVCRGDSDLGDTYVEVNLTRQHVFLYKKGKLVAQSDCVTGKDASPTPSGVFSITYVDHTYEGHQVALVGENYSSDVNYFIPFYGNVGLHDASWRHAFGGSIYHSGGSHGCVNLPYSMADSIYKVVKKGMPVIVYQDSFKVSDDTGIADTTDTTEADKTE